MIPRLPSGERAVAGAAPPLEWEFHGNPSFHGNGSDSSEPSRGQFQLSSRGFGKSEFPQLQSPAEAGRGRDGVGMGLDSCRIPGPFPRARGIPRALGTAQLLLFSRGWEGRSHLNNWEWEERSHPMEGVRNGNRDLTQRVGNGNRDPSRRRGLGMAGERRSSPALPSRSRSAIPAVPGPLPLPAEGTRRAGNARKSLSRAGSAPSDAAPCAGNDPRDIPGQSPG